MAIRVLAIAAILASAGRAQPAEPSLKFEVASIKHAGPGPKTQACLCESPGRIAYRIAPLKWIIERAYQLQDPQVAGPDWLDTETFDIDATLPAGASMQQVPAMLRALLAERFQLSAHIENKEISAFVLSVANGGSKLALAKDGSDASWKQNRNGIHLRLRMKMDELAYYLASTQLQRPVVNETGLEGVFEILLDFAPQMPTDRQNDRLSPPLAVALREQLGLKLEPAKHSVGILIIDRIAKTPTEN